MSVVDCDVVIIGAGAAGLMCAIEAGKRGRRTLVLEHARRPAEKIRISGGGRCNFTNLHAAPENFISANPRFCISALSRYTAADFVDLVKQHDIAFHEKQAGQLFCDRSSAQIVDMLLEECRAAGVTIRLQTEICSVQKDGSRFSVRGLAETFTSESLVIASGGLSIPKMGASGFGYEVARQFGLRVVDTRPGLVPFTFSEQQLQVWGMLSGVATPSAVSAGARTFREPLLFTHRGLSGPAILQISSYTAPGQEIDVDLLPGTEASATLLLEKVQAPHASLATCLARVLPKRLAHRLAELHIPECQDCRMNDVADKRLRELGQAINHWRLTPHGTEGYRTAEVTIGGVDTRDLSSKTMQAREMEGLYFIGEVVDVTGQLGGYNFQWAWSSGFVAGQSV